MINTFLKYSFISIFLYSLTAPPVFCQDFSLSGYILDQDNKVLPGVNIYIKDSETGVTTDNKGRYYFELVQGTYEVVYSMIGYKQQLLKITIDDKSIQRDVWLKEDLIHMEEVLVQHQKRDASYDYMAKAIEYRHQYKDEINEASMDVYIKAFVKTKTTQSKRDIRKEERKKKDTLSIDSILVDTSKLTPNMSFMESKSRLHFKIPDHFKEYRNAYKLYGNKDRLYFTRPSEAPFNFYKSLIKTNLSESMLISPLSPSAFLNYRFKLIGSYFENGQTIYQIKVKPKPFSNAVFSGNIEIIDSLWRIKSVQLSINKQLLNGYDFFEIKQHYKLIDDSTWVMDEQFFTYNEKYGRTHYEGQTFVKYANYELKPSFKSKFFNNELRVTSLEAYQRDSSYWNLNRPKKLTPKEQLFVNQKDSLKDLQTRKEFLDSLDESFNKLRWMNLLYHGQGIVNRSKLSRMYFSSLWDMVEPWEVGGVRIEFWYTYYKKLKDKRSYFFAPYLTYGIRNKNIRGSFYHSSLYNPMNRGWYDVSIGREIDFFNPDDAWVNRFKRSNFFEKDFFAASHYFEIFNGFYLYNNLEYATRNSIDHYVFGELINEVLPETDARSFYAYQAFNLITKLSYTPEQKFLREPYEKIILGSKYPRFTLTYKKGIPSILSSDVDFDFIDFSINQSFKIGVFGTSKYVLKSGRFLNTKKLEYIDYKFHQGADPYLFTNPMYTFQTLRETYTSTNWFFEAHYLHHFNGVFMNKFPLLRKLGFKTVAGTGLLYTLENDDYHAETFLGLERMFKILKNKFRIGLYYAIGTTNFETPRSELKFSLEHYNRRQRKWTF